MTGKHHQHGFPRHHRNDALADANHVRRHADALVRMGAQGIRKVTRNGRSSAVAIWLLQDRNITSLTIG